MEVHHHSHTAADPDSHRGRKKWTHYFWEFLMLFLAVFCGYMAELQLEHKIEKNREKDFIKSMIEDLKKDTINFNHAINSFKDIEARFDTVLAGFDSAIRNYSTRWVYNFVLTVKGGYPDFIYTDRTLQQLKNSGGLRLIKNETAANGIIEYDAGVKDLDIEEKILSVSQENYIRKVHEVWSFRRMYKDNNMLNWVYNYDVEPAKNYWITKDEKAFEQLFNRMAYFSEAIQRQRFAFAAMKTKARKLIEILKTEYHLK